MEGLPIWLTVAAGIIAVLISILQLAMFSWMNRIQLDVKENSAAINNLALTVTSDYHKTKSFEKFAERFEHSLIKIDERLEQSLSKLGEELKLLTLELVKVRGSKNGFYPISGGDRKSDAGIG